MQPASAQVDFVAAPEWTTDPSGRVPLAAAIEFTVDTPVSAHLAISDGVRRWEAEFDSTSAEDGRYTLPVLGMRPGLEHTVTLTVAAARDMGRDTAQGETRAEMPSAPQDEGQDGAGDEARDVGRDTAPGETRGEAFVRTWTHTTPDLPANPLEFPELDIRVAIPERMEPGVTFLSVRRRSLGRPHWMTDRQREFSTQWGLLVALDTRGDVIWYYRSDFRTAGIARLANGNVLMHRTDFSTVEIDLLGNVIREYYAEERPFPLPENPDAIPILGQQTLHHQPHQMPNGDFLAFSANGYLVENYYSSDSDPDAPRTDQIVMADTVVQFTPAGETVWTWNTFDVLDPFRVGYDTFWSYWWLRGFDQYMDWTHANGLSYDAADDSVLVSLRNQSAVLKVDRGSGEIEWILGRHDGWSGDLRDKLLTPVGDLLWPGYQHNPRMTHAGTVILFDNRAHGGAMPFEPRRPLPENFSRGVEYEVDEEDMTVRQVWTSGDSPHEDACFANAMSDAWRLPATDNYLVIFAFCLPRIEGVTQDNMDETRRATADLPYGGRVVEYDGDEIVFRAEAIPYFDLNHWEIYGGFRSSDLYHRPDLPAAH